MTTRQHALVDGDGVVLIDGDGELLTTPGNAESSQQLQVAGTFGSIGVADMLSALQALMPEGILWRRDAATNLTRLLSAIARGLVRMHQRILRLLAEGDPRTTLELLPDWEAVLGLPDPCLGTPATLQERRMVATARWTGRGGQSRAYYVALAASLGYPVTIEEGTVFRVDESPLDEQPLNDWGWVFTWIVHAPATSEIPFRVDESCVDESLLDFGVLRLECAIRRAAPAHTVALFAYGA